MKTKNVLIQQEKRIRDWRLIVIALLAVIVYMVWDKSNAIEDITIHIPPRLERGAVLKVGEVPAPNIYSFSYYLFQMINTWEKDGSKEAPVLLENYSCYLTDDFYSYLTSLHGTRTAKGETRDRARTVREANQKGFDNSKVYQVSEHKWVVKLDMLTREFVNGTEIKNVAVRYPVIVVADDTSPDCNPFGLKFAGYDSSPVRILTK